MHMLDVRVCIDKGQAPHAPVPPAPSFRSRSATANVASRTRGGRAQLGLRCGRSSDLSLLPLTVVAPLPLVALSPVQMHGPSGSSGRSAAHCRPPPSHTASRSPGCLRTQPAPRRIRLRESAPILAPSCPTAPYPSACDATHRRRRHRTSDSLSQSMRAVICFSKSAREGDSASRQRDTVHNSRTSDASAAVLAFGGCDRPRSYNGPAVTAAWSKRGCAAVRVATALKRLRPVWRRLASGSACPASADRFACPRPH